MIADNLVVNGLIKATSKVEVNNLSVNQINSISGDEIAQLSGTTDNIQNQIDTLATSYDESIKASTEFKAEVANAIKRVNSAATVTEDSSFSVFASDIQAIATNASLDADAEANHILKDKTAYVKGVKITGNIPVRGAREFIKHSYFWYDSDGLLPGTLGNTYLVTWIPYGYYREWKQAPDGTMCTEAWISQSDLASIIGLNATKILSGTTYCGIAGSIPDRTSNTGTANLSWAGTLDTNGQPTGGDNISFSSISGQLIIPIPNGYYDGNYNNWGCCGLVVNDIASRLGITTLADRIRSDTSICGVQGTMPMYTYPTHIDYSRIANDRVEFACAGGWHQCWWGGGYEYMSYDEVLDLIGCSADKIVSGQSVLNRAGTAPNYNSGYNDGWNAGVSAADNRSAPGTVNFTSGGENAISMFMSATNSFDSYKSSNTSYRCKTLYVNVGYSSSFQEIFGEWTGSMKNGTLDGTVSYSGYAWSGGNVGSWNIVNWGGSLGAGRFKAVSKGIATVTCTADLGNKYTTHVILFVVY